MSSNWRYNTQTGFYYPVPKSEVHTVIFNDDWQDYGFQLLEAPQLTSGGMAIIPGSGAAPYVEDPISATPPVAGHYMVDYDAPGYDRTGRVRCAAADDGNSLIVSYLGLGKIIPVIINPLLSGFFPRFELFQTAGSFSFQMPDGVTQIYVICIGAGGGGGGSIHGVGLMPHSGAGGGFAEGIIVPPVGELIALIVGAAGAGGANAPGADGGTSSFGSYMTATGGGGGSSGGDLAPLGGIGSGGDMNGSLGDAKRPSRTSTIASGRGGGPGGHGMKASNGHNATGPGGGGGGTASDTKVGGNGADGLIAIFY